MADIPSTSSSDLSNRSNEEFLLLSVETNNNLGNEATTERECMTHMGSRWKLLYEKKFDISGNDTNVIPRTSNDDNDYNVCFEDDISQFSSFEESDSEEDDLGEYGDDRYFEPMKQAPPAR